ncbi:class I SAM-dependent methyltransferase [Ancylobacter sp.]|uniref:class I SAM-dependent methyltransferase n=1 Tax=Ancylobacter sp. TaxID=1872567 RepID=UPI003D104DF7
MSYSDYIEWKDWREDAFGTCLPGQKAYFDAEIGPYIAYTRPAETCLVEVGFGNGPLLAWGRSRGIDVIGSEIQPALQQRARQAGYKVVDNLSEIPAGTADIVVALDVFEHVPYDELILLCRDIARILKPEGCLLARFPNGDSPFSMPFQNGDATHVHALGANKIRRLMSASGFAVEALRAPFEPRFSVRGRLFMPVRRVMRWIYASFVRLAFMEGDTPSTFTANYLLVARKPKRQT